MRHYSLFDFDGTLTVSDSFTGFIRHVCGLGGFVRVMILSAPAILLWKLGFRSNVYAKLKMFSEAFRGMRIDDFRRMGRLYVSRIDSITRSKIVEAMRESVGKGDVVAIVSASLGDWIRPWAKENGVTHVIATEPEVDAGGRLTGRFRTSNCELDEKVRRVLEYFPELRSRREDFMVTAYGDSPADRPLLDFADTGILISK